jgi:hypothetical protein
MAAVLHPNTKEESASGHDKNRLVAGAMQV